MPVQIPVSYGQLGQQITSLIQEINISKSPGAKSMSDYLWQLKDDNVEKCFPMNWLNKIKVCVIPDLPAPKLNTLRQKMGYSLIDFQKECNKVNRFLFQALKNFSYPLNKSIVGITYDKVIYL